MVHAPITHFVRPALLALTFLFFFTACKGPQGDPGPAGATGSTGATGATGAQGATGTANVMQFSYGSRTHTGAEQVYTMTGMTADAIAKSAVFVYIYNGNYWYPIPGIFNGTNEYRTNIRPSANSQIAVVRVGSGTTTTDTFAATRIIIIPASDLRNGRQAALDFNDYAAVKAFYQLPD